jgi:hypothetical protein
MPFIFNIAGEEGPAAYGKLLISGKTDSGDGLEKSIGSPGYTTFTFSSWVYTTAAADDLEEIFENSDGTFRILVNTQSTNRRIQVFCGGATSNSAVQAFPALDTWFHLLVHAGTDFNSTTDVRIYVNGTASGTAGTAVPLSSTTLNTDWRLLQNDTKDNSFTGWLFDVGLFSSIIDPADDNYNGGNWVDYSSGAKSNLICRLTGQNPSDAGEDFSGQAFHWSQSAGGGSVVVSGSDLPPGANP